MSQALPGDREHSGIGIRLSCGVALAEGRCAPWVGPNMLGGSAQERGRFAVFPGSAAGSGHHIGPPDPAGAFTSLGHLVAPLPKRSLSGAGGAASRAPFPPLLFPSSWSPATVPSCCHTLPGPWAVVLSGRRGELSPVTTAFWPQPACAPRLGPPWSLARFCLAPQDQTRPARLLSTGYYTQLTLAFQMREYFGGLHRGSFPRTHLRVFTFHVSGDFLCSLCDSSVVLRRIVIRTPEPLGLRGPRPGLFSAAWGKLQAPLSIRRHNRCFRYCRAGQMPGRYWASRSTK